MRSARAFGKINLGLVVGPAGSGGRHEVVTVLQRIALADTIELEPAGTAVEVTVRGFDDTLVRAALQAFCDAAGGATGWRALIDKRIPVAAGLGGGSSDAATALSLANELSGRPLRTSELHAIAARLGADVPFFLRPGAQLATGDGTELAPLGVELDVAAVLVLPAGERKESTGAVYERFDARRGADGFDARRAAALAALERPSAAIDLVRALPGNDLATSPLADELVWRGAFRAEVSGAGPAVYGLFEHQDDAEAAAEALATRGETIVTRTVTGS
jgi:4-diphosphocytidyl-2-C-methyl-D-erythritol kinase